jgi:hypothetical protein
LGHSKWTLQVDSAGDEKEPVPSILAVRPPARSFLDEVPEPLAENTGSLPIRTIETAGGGRGDQDTQLIVKLAQKQIRRYDVHRGRPLDHVLKG